ncbi:hypothetical protein E2C01_000181 [Portunus trituberculatus]|uniref:Uncharacterized protein n=1 Tax=Portunus trituberculatus TaxID=210409 RepID=A0A5B7CE00_PORTR|nr:hypothetical protein [Portunus trituberculatus]
MKAAFLTAFPSVSFHSPSTSPDFPWSDFKAARHHGGLRSGLPQVDSWAVNDAVWQNTELEDRQAAVSCTKTAFPSKACCGYRCILRCPVMVPSSLRPLHHLVIICELYYDAVLSSLVAATVPPCLGNADTLQRTFTMYAVTSGNFLQIINLALRSVVSFIVRCAGICVDGSRREGTQAAWRRRTRLKKA